MRTVRIYLLLVCLPLLLLLPTLRRGRTFDAPPAVGGEWKAEDGSVLRLVQSGVFVEATLSRGGETRTHRARLSRNELTGEIVVGAGTSFSVLLTPADRPTTGLVTLPGARIPVVREVRP